MSGIGLGGGFLVTVRLFILVGDDHLRAYAIERLMCDMSLDLSLLDEEFGGDADRRHLAVALARLAPAERDGLLRRGDQYLKVTPVGRLLVHHLAEAFDARAGG